MRRFPFNVATALLLAAPLLAGCLERNAPPPMSGTLTEDDDMYCRRDRDAQRNAAIARADRKQQDLGDYMLNHPSDAGRQHQ